MQVTLATKEYDPRGYVIVDVSPTESNFKKRTRRVKATPVLSGRMFVHDGGFGRDDESFEFVTELTDEEEWASLVYLIENYSRIYFMFDAEFYEGIISELSYEPPLRIKLTVTEKLV